MTVTCGMCPCYVCASWQFFVAILLLRFPCRLPLCTHNSVREMVNERMRIVNAERGEWTSKKKIMVNVVLKPELWPAQKSWEVWMRRLILKAHSNTNAGGQVNCGFLLCTAYHLAYVWAHSNLFASIFHLQCITQIRSCVIYVHLAEHNESVSSSFITGCHSNRIRDSYIWDSAWQK